MYTEILFHTDTLHNFPIIKIIYVILLATNVWYMDLLWDIFLNIIKIRTHLNEYNKNENTCLNNKKIKRAFINKINK